MKRTLMTRALAVLLWAGTLACSDTGTVTGVGGTVDGGAQDPGSIHEGDTTQPASDTVSEADVAPGTDTASEDGGGTTDAAAPKEDAVASEDHGQPDDDTWTPPDEGPPPDVEIPDMYQPNDGSADAGPPDGADLPPTGCWVPDAPEEGVTMDCDQICTAVSTCGVPGASACPDICSVLKSYVAAGIDAGIQQCIVGGGCSFSSGFSVFTECGASEAASGNWEIPASNAGVCDAIEARFDECGQSNSGFTMMCSTYASMFNAEAMAKIDACKDATCDELIECLNVSNCAVQKAMSLGGGPGGGDFGGPPPGDSGGPPGPDFGGPPGDFGGPPPGDGGGFPGDFGGPPPGDFGGPPPGDGGGFPGDFGGPPPGDFGGPPPGDFGGPPPGDQGPPGDGGGGPGDFGGPGDQGPPGDMGPPGDGGGGAWGGPG